MVAKIVSGKSIRGLLNYNENKVAEGKAQIIMASQFGEEIDKLNFSNKLNRFEHLTDLNSRVKTNSLHIMLNFDLGENLDNFKLQQITATYMEKIGFGEQPYLVYNHYDAAHPHIHIVTTNMQQDGTRISLHNIGKSLSEPARKEIEQEFGLVKAEGKGLKEALGIKPIRIEKAEYGITPTKRAITNVVNVVSQTYKYTSLAELNAVLKQFNVIADRGKEDTMMFQKKGLIYSIVDEKGNKIGIPFKASSIAGKPTLDHLEKQFEKNEERRKPFRDDLKAAIERVFKGYQTITKDTFMNDLAKQNVKGIFRQNEQGFTYGVTFIDNKNKTVFNGSDLGKAYSAKSLMERFSNVDKPIQSIKELTSYLKHPTETKYLKKDRNENQPEKTYLKPERPGKILESLLGKAEEGDLPQIPEDKRKKKKELHL